MSKGLMWAVVMVSACAGVGVDVDVGDGVSVSELVADPCDYPQAFGNGTHTGTACKEQRGMKIVATLLQDPDADEEFNQRGFLSVHESPPLTQGDFVVVPGKANFTNIFDRTGQTWNVTGYKWSPSVMAPNATLNKIWSYQTDWQPTESLTGAFSYATGYENLFAPVLTSTSAYVPAKFGRIKRLNLATGAVVATINPLAGTPFDGDTKTIVSNALSIDSVGNVYFTVVAYPLVDNESSQPRGSWLVKVKPDNTFVRADWATIATPALGVKTGIQASCEWFFGAGGTPAATGPTSQPPLLGCGDQRPPLNAPVAIDEANHRLIVFSEANNAFWYTYLIAVNDTTLAPITASDTRGHLTYGCGRRLALDFDNCDLLTNHGTTNLGVDPDFNRPVAFFGSDIMDNAPWVAPNGDFGIGGYDGGFQFEGPGGFDARGALIVFNSAGAFTTKNEEYGWEVTPTVAKNADGTFSYLQDRNLFSDFDLTISKYSSAFSIEREDNIPLSLEPNAIHFVNANVLLDTTGRHYAMNADGYFRAFDAAGKQVDHVTMTNADGAPRSIPPLSSYNARDRAGRIYVSYAGSVYVIAGSGADAGPAPTPAVNLRTLAGQKAKYAGARNAKRPEPPAQVAPGGGS